MSRQGDLWAEIAGVQPKENSKGQAIPKPWSHTQGACPPILGITLHRPWSWAFFDGNPQDVKDVENLHEGFPRIPPGTWLALHNGRKWDKASETTIKQRLPRCQGKSEKDCPAGYIVGAVQVEKITRGDLLIPRRSRWYMGWGTGVWLEPGRHLFTQPIPCPQGWFGAWELPQNIEIQVRAALAGLGVIL